MRDGGCSSQKPHNIPAKNACTPLCKRRTPMTTVQNILFLITLPPVTNIDPIIPVQKYGKRTHLLRGDIRKMRKYPKRTHFIIVAHGDVHHAQIKIENGGFEDRPSLQDCSASWVTGSRPHTINGAEISRMVI